MVENTLSVGRISEGFVLDHIEAGKSMEIYKLTVRIFSRSLRNGCILTMTFLFENLYPMDVMQSQN